MNETPQLAARRFSARAIQDGYEPSGFYEYRDANGTIVYHRIRCKRTSDGAKWIRPMRTNGHGYELGEPAFPTGKPLYRLPDLIARAADPVWFVEGESCADSLAKLGVLATTSGAADSAKHADFSPLAKRHVIVWPDNDEAGLRHAREVAERLIDLGAKVRLIEISKLNLQQKGDCVDWLAAHPDVTAADLDKLPLKIYAKSESARTNTPTATAEPPRKSQSTRLVELAEHLTLFHDDDDAYAIIPANDHTETWPLRSKHFRDYLNRRYYLTERRAAGGQAVEDALRTISGKAHFECPQHHVHRRIAEHDGAIYIDLCDNRWRAIEVTAQGWQISPNPPVRFIRSPGMQALPLPQAGRNIELLWKYLHVDDPAERSLIVAFLSMALRPHGPYPVLILQGEGGAGKSSFARVVRSLIDPSAVPLRTLPRGEQDLLIAARNSWLLALDNLSGLQPWQSDALCRIATGIGSATRELYSDTDEVFINVQRPIILNGIDDIATRQDLISRAIIMNLPAIPEEQQLPEAEFWEAFEADRPAILGALLDRISRAMGELPHVKAKLPRMADFAKWAIAAEPESESGKFLKAYAANRKDAMEAGLEGSPVAVALRVVMRNYRVDKLWEGTATELLKKLTAQADLETRSMRSWPRSPKALGSQLRRLAHGLRVIGIQIEHFREGDKANARKVRIFASETVLRPKTSENNENQWVGVGRKSDAKVASDANGTLSDANANGEKAHSRAVPDVSDVSDAKKQTSICTVISEDGSDDAEVIV